MKRIVALVIISILVLSACSNTPTSSNDSEIEALKSEIQSLKEENERLKQSNDNTSSIDQQDSKPPSSESAAKQVDDIFANVTVTVTEKNVLDQGYSRQFIEFVFSIDNQFDKDIKGIEGTLEIMDMFGKNMMTVNCDFTEKNVPAQNITVYKEKGLDYNQFMDTHIKIMDTPFENMIFKYTVKTIMFTDGEVLQ